MWPFDAPKENLTHEFSAGAALNTALNPFARITGPYYVPKAFSRFPTSSNKYFNASLFQAGALGTSYLALAGLARYVTGLSELERRKAAAAKQIKDRVGVEEEEVEINKPAPELPKTAAVADSLTAFAIPMAALAVGISGGYALASRKLAKDRAVELDQDIAEAENKLTKAKTQAMGGEPAPIQKAAEIGIPSASTMLALAGLGLASVYATSAIIAKKQFDAGDEARVNQKATDAAFKALTRARLAASDTDLHLVERERALKSLAGHQNALPAPKPVKALPAASDAIQSEPVRPYESVPV